MPHALILLAGDTLTAYAAFDEVVDPAVPRVALIDTIDDEKFAAIELAERFGERLGTIRFDTPGSRRGDFRALIEETRWELDLRGHDQVAIFVSGGIGEAEIVALNDLVAGYGIGGEISDAPIVDFAMDIIEIEGEPLAKRGKWSGSKQVWRDPAGNDAIRPRPAPAPGPNWRPLLVNSEAAGVGRTATEIRDAVLAQLPLFPFTPAG